MKTLPLLAHLEELRRRLAVSLGAVAVLLVPSYYWVAPEVVRWLGRLAGRPLRTIGLAEAFFLRLEIALLAACLLALPIVAREAWAFVAPGLYPEERRATGGLALASTLLAAAGALFALGFLIPVTIGFFLAEAGEMGVEYLAGAESIARTALLLTAACAAAFQLPLALLALARAGIATPAWLKHTRRQWIVGIFLLSAILTPTSDLFTMTALALPMCLLFEATRIAIGRMPRA